MDLGPHVHISVYTFFRNYFPEIGHGKPWLHIQKDALMLFLIIYILWLPWQHYSGANGWV
jgi:TRAP-type C4-dicarboxylate transport system permease small subunit